MKKKPQTESFSAVERVALSSGEIVILPGELRDDLNQLIAELNAQFEPKTGTERFLVEQMVHARWKLARFRRLEAKAYLQITGSEGSPDGEILAALAKPGNIVEKLERMIAAADRAFSKAVRELNQARAAAAKTRKQNKANDAEAWLQAELAKLQNEPNDTEAWLRAEFAKFQNEPDFDPEPYLTHPTLEPEEPSCPPPGTE